MNNDETGQDCTGQVWPAVPWSHLLCSTDWVVCLGQARPGEPGVTPASGSIQAASSSLYCRPPPPLQSHTTNIPVTVSQCHTQQTYLSQCHTTNYLIVVFLNFLNSRKISAYENYFLFSEQNCSEAQKVTHIYWRGWAANLKPSRNNQVSLAGVWTGRSPPRTWTVWERPSHYLMLTGQKKLLEKNLAR